MKVKVTFRDLRAEGYGLGERIYSVENASDDQDAKVEAFNCFMDMIDSEIGITTDTDGTDLFYKLSIEQCESMSKEDVEDLGKFYEYEDEDYFYSLGYAGQITAVEDIKCEVIVEDDEDED